MSVQKTVLITGGAGGLGKSASLLLAKYGWHVFAADFDQTALECIEQENNITPIRLDVTDTDSVEAAAERVGKEVDGLDGIVNFAGILAMGSLIEIKEETLARLMDVNFMGMYRVNKAFFALVLNRKGRIVNISSEVGRLSGLPFNGAYGISKHAVEAYSDSLRREVGLLGVPVIKIQPGPFKTDMVFGIERRFQQAVDESKLFKKQLSKVKTLAMGENAKAHAPEIIAESVYKVLTTANPAPAYSVKADISRDLLNYLPDRVVDGIFRLVLKV
jgi:NAD(P)-dependent dehydrogenase (short-subunit alcohol dehydrogenase family)